MKDKNGIFINDFAKLNDQIGNLINKCGTLINDFADIINQTAVMNDKYAE